MRQTWCLLSAITGVLALSASPAAAAEYVAPPANPIVIDLVTANGSGCLPGTAAVTIDPDNSSFTVTYSAFTALVGVDAQNTDWRKNCQLNVVVQAPPEYRYTITQADSRGFASLAAGAGATQRANYYFQGQTQTAYNTHTFAGPADLDWQTTDDVPAQSIVWSPCGVARNLNINTELRVTAGTSNTATTTSLMTMDSAVYHLTWDLCL
jgi:hypothetical protein